MSETQEQVKHTKGPWTADTLDGGYHVISGKGGTHVTDFVKPCDAPLIASAPDLLTACKVLALALDRLSTECSQIPGHLAILQLAEATIARAEGRE